MITKEELLERLNNLKQIKDRTEIAYYQILGQISLLEGLIQDIDKKQNNAQ